MLHYRLCADVQYIAQEENLRSKKWWLFLIVGFDNWFRHKDSGIPERIQQIERIPEKDSIFLFVFDLVSGNVVDLFIGQYFQRKIQNWSPENSG